MDNLTFHKNKKQKMQIQKTHYRSSLQTEQERLSKKINRGEDNTQMHQNKYIFSMFHGI